MGAKDILIGLLIFGFITFSFYSMQSELYSTYGVDSVADYSSNLSATNETLELIEDISIPMNKASVADTTVSEYYYIAVTGVAIIKSIIQIPDLLIKTISNAINILPLSGLPVTGMAILKGIIMVIIIFELIGYIFGRK